MVWCRTPSPASSASRCSPRRASGGISGGPIPLQRVCVVVMSRRSGQRRPGRRLLSLLEHALGVATPLMAVRSETQCKHPKCAGSLFLEHAEVVSGKSFPRQLGSLPGSAMACYVGSHGTGDWTLLSHRGEAMQAVATVTVNVLVAVEEQEGLFFADCPFLNIVSQGRTEEEALAHFQEELQFLLETCQEGGELEALLDYRTGLRRPLQSSMGPVRVERKVRKVPAEIPAGLLNQFAHAAASFH